MSTPATTSNPPLLPHLLTDSEGQTGAPQDNSLIKRGQKAVEEIMHTTIQGHVSMTLALIKNSRREALELTNEEGLPLFVFSAIFAELSASLLMYDMTLRNSLHGCVYNSKIGMTKGSDIAVFGSRGWKLLNGEYPEDQLDQSCQDQIREQESLIFSSQYVAIGKFLKKKRALLGACAVKVDQPLEEDLAAMTTEAHVNAFFDFLEKKILKYTSKLQGKIMELAIFHSIPQIIPSEGFVAELAEGFAQNSAR